MKNQCIFKPRKLIAHFGTDKRRLATVFVAGILAIGLIVSGCATNRISGWDRSSTRQSHLSSKEEIELLAEAKKLWQDRHVQASLEAALQKLEIIAQSNPENLEVLVLLSRGYYLLADAHLTDMKLRKETWEKGTAWGERAMAIHPEFQKRVGVEKGKVEDALEVLDRKFIAAIYWTAVNLGKWSKNSGISTALKYKSRIKQMIEHVEKLDPDFFYGAVPRYWGTYFAVVPGFAGGSLEKSHDQYQKSLQKNKFYLATHVLFAENYATRKDDRELFKKHLKIVIDTPADVLPELKPENILEQRKAKKMLEEMESYF